MKVLSELSVHIGWSAAYLGPAGRWAARPTIDPSIKLRHKITLQELLLILYMLKFKGEGKVKLFRVSLSLLWI